MSNGECAVGSANKAKIENLEKKQASQDALIQRVDEKLDKMNWWLVALLGGMVVSLIMQLTGKLMVVQK